MGRELTTAPARFEAKPRFIPHGTPENACGKRLQRPARARGVTNMLIAVTDGRKSMPGAGGNLSGNHVADVASFT